MITEEIIIVPKKWGCEWWLVNREYCGKLLFLNKGAVCSYHKHILKTETFYCLKGLIELTINDETYTLDTNDEPITILPGDYHQFAGLEESVILEISTHHEDSDVERKTESEANKNPI